MGQPTGDQIISGGGWGGPSVEGIEYASAYGELRGAVLHLRRTHDGSHGDDCMPCRVVAVADEAHARLRAVA